MQPNYLYIQPKYLLIQPSHSHIQSTIYTFSEKKGLNLTKYLYNYIL